MANKTDKNSSFTIFYFIEGDKKKRKYNKRKDIVYEK